MNWTSTPEGQKITAAVSGDCVEVFPAPGMLADRSNRSAPCCQGSR